MKGITPVRECWSFFVSTRPPIRVHGIVQP